MLAAEVCGASPAYDYEVRTMLEFDWEAYLTKVACELRGRCASHSKSPLVLIRCDGQYTYVGGLDEIQALAKEELERSPAAYNRKALETKATALYRETLVKRRRPMAFLDIRFNAAVATTKPKKVIIELYDDVCPRTCENFLALCSGEQGECAETGTQLHYRDCRFHRVVRDGWVQTGDVPGVAPFPDESFAVPFDRPGIIAMANTGPHTNASQFFITLAPLPWLDKTAVAFGGVVKGMAAVRQIGSLQTNNERPIEDCIIASCGTVSLDTGLGLQ
ncbi:hypothetical protein CTAYLR_001530 [Chrysophaeum taylorii]|uniref:Peptidyl-prolyl cis-trans isomerase n=1 Tax=Chrysophaeum taylorii TaxID=2483200 RepID=A0AAD7UD81_9STRA|nr:hypothetical protein CTAYLR_001530 [Chrysophaeum taylorii]